MIDIINNKTHMMTVSSTLQIMDRIHVMSNYIDLIISIDGIPWYFPLPIAYRACLSKGDI